MWEKYNGKLAEVLSRKSGVAESSKKRQRPANSEARDPGVGVAQATLRCSPLAAAEIYIVGVPFYDVSFRAFTASPTVLKGTPTAQPFDNRSIA